VKIEFSVSTKGLDQVIDKAKRNFRTKLERLAALRCPVHGSIGRIEGDTIRWPKCCDEYQQLIEREQKR
jgi:hypothetical protein